MLLGIFTFVLVYTFVECHPAVQRKLKSDPALRLATKIGYGTRVGISILFPIGIGVDIWVGMLAVTITGWGGARFGRSSKVSNFWAEEFFSFYITTIVQGILLNLILLGYLLVVYAIIVATGRYRAKEAEPYNVG